MNSTPSTPSTVAATPGISLKDFVALVGEVHRWRMLCELSCGETREIDELARAAGCSYNAAGRHAMELYRSGVVIRGRGRTYQLAPRYLPKNGEPYMDFGHCLIRTKPAE